MANDVKCQIQKKKIYILTRKFHINCQEMAQLHLFDTILDKGEGPRLGYVLQETLTCFGEYCQVRPFTPFQQGTPGVF